LLAIGILAIGCSTVLFLFTMGARSHRRAVDRTRSALLADAVFSQVRADLAAALPARYAEQADKTIAPIQNQTHADFPEFRYDLTFAPLYQGDYYVVKVRVWWGEWFDVTDGANSARDPNPDSTVFETLVRRKSF